MSAPAPVDALRSLRDVGDLLGSFVVSDFGEVVVRDVPSVFDDETLDEAATRLVRLRETLDGSDDPMEHALLDYGEHKLFLRAFTGATLIVLAPRGVNVPSLRMAATLVARKLERSLGAYPTAPRLAEAAPAPVSTPPPRVSSVPPIPAAPPVPAETRAIVPPPPPPLATSVPPMLPELPRATAPAIPKRIFRGVPIG